MAERDLKVRYVADAKDVEAKLGQIDRAHDTFASKLKGIGSQLQAGGRALTAGLTLPIVGIGTAATMAAITFEDSFAGVRKTVNATEAEFAALSAGFRKMAKEIPISVNELNRIGEAAGQLGIEKGNILAFTRVMADLGVATNLSSDQAATALARLANITKMPQDRFDELGSTIVALGNSFATTESEIVEMGLRLAGAGSQIGLTEPQILGMAAALSSVGIEAEAGGSAMSRAMIAIANAVADGGKELDAFAKVAGASSSEFAQAFRERPAEAIQAFVSGLDRMAKEGTNVFAVLDELGLGEIRVRDALLRTAGAGDLLARSIKLGTNAWHENTALTDEASKRYATTKSQLLLFKNEVMDVAIRLGETLLPVLRGLVERAQPVIDAIAKAVDWFGKLDPKLQLVILGVLGLVAAIGPLLLVVGTMAVGIAALATPIMGTVAAIVGIIAVVATLAVAIALNWDRIKDATERVWNAIGTFFSVTIPAKLEALAGWFRDLPGRVGAFLAELPGRVASLLGQVVGTAIRLGAEAFLAYVRFWQELPGRVLNVLVALPGRLVEWGGRVKDAALEFVPKIISGLLDLDRRVWEVFTQMWASITEFLRKLPGRLFDIAKDIAKGFWEGFKKGLGISSPSLVERAFMAIASSAENSLATVAGAVRGMDATLGQLPPIPEPAFAGASAGTIGRTGPFSVPAPVMAGGVIGPIVLELDGRVVAEVTREQLLRMAHRSGAVLQGTA